MLYLILLLFSLFAIILILIITLVHGMDYVLEWESPIPLMPLSCPKNCSFRHDWAVRSIALEHGTLFQSHHGQQVICTIV